MAFPLARTLVMLAAVGGVAVATTGVLRAQTDGLAAPRRVPAPTLDIPETSTGPQTAVLAGGCFWGLQGVYEHVKGVKQVLAGYSGGRRATASYETVSTGLTGHAESVQITYDPKVISYGELLRIYFSVATDPTQVGGQFPDQGSQYRGEVFYTTPAQKRVADAYIAELNKDKAYPKALTTHVDPDQGFFAAERYHQDYLVRHPDQPYIATYDMPKVEALQQLFPQHYAAQPITALSLAKN